MPTYDFQCPECQYRKEFWAHIDAVDLLEVNGIPRCTNCGRSVMKRLLSVPGIIFRGGGWASKS